MYKPADCKHKLSYIAKTLQKHKQSGRARLASDAASSPCNTCDGDEDEEVIVMVGEDGSADHS